MDVDTAFFIYCPIADDVIPVCNSRGEDFDCEKCIVASASE